MEYLAVEGRVFEVIKHSPQNWEVHLGDGWVTVKGQRALKALARKMNDADRALWREYMAEQADRRSAGYHF